MPIVSSSDPGEIVVPLHVEDVSVEAVAALRGAAVEAMADIRSAWMDWMGQTARAGTQMPQDFLHQVAERQLWFAAEAMQGWMEHNARVMQITMQLAQGSFHPFVRRFNAGSMESVQTVGSAPFLALRGTLV